MMKYTNALSLSDKEPRKIDQLDRDVYVYEYGAVAVPVFLGNHSDILSQLSIYQEEAH